MKILEIPVTRHLKVETYDLNDFQNRRGGVIVTVEFIKLNPLPTGSVRLMLKDKEASEWSHITGMSAGIADHASDGTGSVVFHELSLVNGNLGLEYTKGNETSGIINIYAV